MRSYALGCAVLLAIVSIVPDAPGAPATDDAASPAEAKPAPRLPMPSEQDIAAAIPIIQEAFAAQLAAARANAGELSAVLAVLLEAAEQTTAPGRRYALLREAEAAANDAGTVDELLRIVNLRCAQFTVDPTSAAVEALDRFMATHQDDPARLESAVKAALASATRARDASRPEQAETMLASATRGNAALAKAFRKRKIPSPPVKVLADEIAAQRKQLAEHVAQEAALTAARAALATNPDDAAANTALGSHLCFVRGDWKAGLPALAKGEAADLRTAAAAELELLAGGDPSPSAVFAVANAWWAAAEAARQPQSEVSAIKAHAAAMYRELGGKLTDPIDAQLATRRAGTAVARSSRKAPLPTAFKRRGESAEIAAVEGGGADTEQAVDRGLQWLAGHQCADGGWTFDLNACPGCQGKCSHPGSSTRNDRAAATALALLPFLGRGSTHREGPYQKEVDGGVRFLTAMVLEGKGKAYASGGSMYSQGLVGIALAECYGMSKDTRLAAPARATLTYIMQAQDPQGGGWRYSPRQPGDTSSFGWQMAALTTGSLAALPVERSVMQKAAGFLDFVQSDGGAAYGYIDGSSPSPTRSAIGLLGRLSTGWTPDHPALRRGVVGVGEKGPTKDLYFDYYATRLLHRVGGEGWAAWNAQMKPLLLGAQSRREHETGSWYEEFDGGHGATVGGRLYCTALAILILEEYYR